MTAQPYTATRRLTSTHHRMLSLLAKGYGNEEIGRASGLLPHQVVVELFDLFRVLGVANRQQAVAWARREGLVALRRRPGPKRSPRCRKGLHDLTVPGAVKVNRVNGRRRCRACAHNREQNARALLVACRVAAGRRADGR